MPSKPFTLSSLKTLLTTVLPYKWQVHFQIKFLRTCCTGTFASCTQNYISGPFSEQANLPKTCTIFYIDCLNLGSTYHFFFKFYKGSYSDFKLKIYLKSIINFIVFVGWDQLTMMTTQGVSIHHNNHPNCHIKWVNSSWWPPKLGGSIHHDDHNKWS